MRTIAPISITIYASGVVLYSALFIASSNQDPMIQLAKVFVAAAHSLFLILPVVLAQSRNILLKVLGFAMVGAYFVFALFLVGFFPYFGFVPEVYAFDLGSIRDLGEVSDHYIVQLFGWREVALIALFFLLVWQITRVPIPTYGLTIIAAPAILLATSLHSFGHPSSSEKFGNVTVLRRFGPVVFSYASISEWLSLSGTYLAEQTDFPGPMVSLNPASTSPRQAFVSEVPIVSRVTIVQIESFDPMAIDARLSGLPVMPFVSGLRESCLNYKNFFTMKGAGGSSDAEFSVATGLVPSTRVPSLKHMDFAHVETLYDLLAANGIASTFSHNNQSGFYGRNRAYAQVDSLETRFMNPLQPIAEVEFARDALAETLRTSEKSLHYFFNFQSHGPYQGYSAATEKKFSIRRGDDLKADYLATMNEVDEMIGDLFELQGPGFEDGDNLFILLADHPSYLHSSWDEVSRHRVPAMICHKSFEAADIETVFGNVDLSPTIIEAFGLKPDRQHLGQSMFWDAPNAVLLPVRKIIHLNSDGLPELRQCDGACDAYFTFTEQYIRH